MNWTIHSNIMELPEKSVQLSAFKEVYKRQHLLFIPVIFLRAPKTYSVSSFHSSVLYKLKSFHLNIQGLKLFTYKLLAGTKLSSITLYPLKASGENLWKNNVDRLTVSYCTIKKQTTIKTAFYNEGWHLSPVQGLCSCIRTAYSSLSSLP